MNKIYITTLILTLTIFTGGCTLTVPTNTNDNHTSENVQKETENSVEETENTIEGSAEESEPLELTEADLDTSTWETYTNEEYGLEIDYPKSMTVFFDKTFKEIIISFAGKGDGTQYSFDVNKKPTEKFYARTDDQESSYDIAKRIYDDYVSQDRGIHFQDGPDTWYWKVETVNGVDYVVAIGNCYEGSENQSCAYIQWQTFIADKEFIIKHAYVYDLPKERKTVAEDLLNNKIDDLGVQVMRKIVESLKFYER
ncbi:MAG: hypothetical protein GF349_04280 [Candidatus Magasanikbacteria bacterium]|nr:hypothetical protein [Candidatus Magasanikbacteria bacterium]